MKVRLLISVVLGLAVGCMPKTVTENVTFALKRAARGEYVAARLESSRLKASAEVTVSVGGMAAKAVSFNERVVVFEVPPEARETAEPVPVVVSDGRTKAEGQLQILGEVVPAQITSLVLPQIDFSGKLEEAAQNFFKRENGLFSNLRTVTGAAVGLEPQERRTLFQPLSDTGFEARLC